MCLKGNKKEYPRCELLNGKKMSRSCPLEGEDYFNEQILKFEQAVNAFLDNDEIKCKSLLKTIKHQEISEWCLKHAQVIGHTRIMSYSGDKPKSVSDRDVQLSKTISKKVFKRDNYHCRYCGRKLFSREFFKQFAEAIGDKSVFSYGRKNDEKHGIVHICLPFADHVKPRHLGGRTGTTEEPSDNLVTSCGPCNFGKHNFTLDQLGLDDPRKRERVQVEWDGFESKIEQVKRRKKILVKK